MRIGVTALILACVPAALLGGAWSEPAVAAPAKRHSGTVVSLDAETRTLVLREIVERGKERTLTVRVRRQAAVIFSERLPDWQVTSPRHPFRDIPIRLADIRPGDWVIVELTRHGSKAETGVIIVTFRKEPGRAI